MSGWITNLINSISDTVWNTQNPNALLTSAIIFFCFVWIMAIIYTIKDIVSRTNNIFLRILSVLFVTVGTPLLWLPLYRAIRPVSIKKKEAPTSSVKPLIICHSCKKPNGKNYTYCVFCWNNLKTMCKNCWNQYPYNFEYCFQCGSPNLDT